MMAAQSSAIATGRLERSCKHGVARIRAGAVGDGIEWAEAFFRDRAFAPHRHDSYAIGMTLSGVQHFAYRGARRQCLPGELHVLHPDEIHDGAPGSEDGFAYRIVYVDPALIAEALGHTPLPFVADPVVSAASEPVQRLKAAIACIDEPHDALAVGDLLTTLADALAAMTGEGTVRRPTIDSTAMARVRAALIEEDGAATPMAGLEAVAGLDRWALARQFRLAYGTSPHRFRLMRRLERARRLMAAGVGLAEAAAASGFADQSHMTRQFKCAYGLTPARWLKALATA